METRRNTHVSTIYVQEEGNQDAKEQAGGQRPTIGRNFCEKGCKSSGQQHAFDANIDDTRAFAQNAAQRTITGHLLGDRAVGMAEVGELLTAA